MTPAPAPAASPARTGGVPSPPAAVNHSPISSQTATPASASATQPALVHSPTSSPTHISSVGDPAQPAVTAAATGPLADFQFGGHQVLVTGPPMHHHIEVYADGRVATFATPIGHASPSSSQQHLSPRSHLLPPAAGSPRASPVAAAAPSSVAHTPMPQVARALTYTQPAGQQMATPVMQPSPAAPSLFGPPTPPGPPSPYSPSPQIGPGAAREISEASAVAMGAQVEEQAELAVKYKRAKRMLKARGGVLAIHASQCCCM